MKRTNTDSNPYTILVSPSSIEEQNFIEELLKKMHVNFEIDSDGNIPEFHRKILDERIEFRKLNPDSYTDFEKVVKKIKTKYDI